MKEYLEPLLRRMRASGVWLGGTLLVTWGIGTLIGLAFASAFPETNGWPTIVGLVAGLAASAVLVAMTITPLEPRLSADELVETLDIAGRATAELLEAATSLMVAQLELTIQVVLRAFPDMPDDLALQLAQVVPTFRREVADILSDLREGRQPT